MNAIDNYFNNSVLKVIWNASNDGIALSDADGIVLRVNKKYCEIYGYSEDEVLNKSFAIIFDKDFQDVAIEQYKEIYNTDEIPPKFESQVLRKNGDKRYVESKIDFVYDNGNKIGMISFIKDITELKESEQYSKEIEIRYKNLIEHDQYPKLIIDPLNGNIVYCNRAAREFYGYDDLTKMNILDINDIPKSIFNKKIAEAIEFKTKNFRFKHKIKSGEVRNVEVFSNPMEVAGKKILLATIKDITTDVEKNNQLKEINERLSFITNNIPGIIYQAQIDENNKLIFNFISEKSEDLFGYKPEYITSGKVSFVDRIYHEDKSKLFEAINNSNKDLSLFEVEIRIYDKYNEIKWLRTFSIPYKDDNNNTIWNGIALDVTEENEYRIKIQDQKEEIVSQNEEMRLQNLELKKLNNELKLSEDKFRGIFDYANVGIVLADYESTITEANDEFSKFIGYSKHELIGMKVSDISTSDDYEEEYNKVRKLFKRESDSYSMDKRYKRKDGEIVWGSLSIAPRINEKGEIYQYIGIIKDINEYKKAKIALEKSEIKFRKFFDNFADAVFVADTSSGIIVDANKKAQKLLEMDYDDIIGIHQTELHPKAKEENAKETFKQHKKAVFEDNNIIPIINTLVSKSGKEIPVEIIASSIELNNKKFMLGVFRDITDRIAAREAVEVSEERLRTLINSTPDIICFKDGKGRWLVANDAMLDLFELQGVDYFGKTDLELAEYTNPIYRKLFLNFLVIEDKVWKAAKTINESESMTRSDGTEKIYDVFKVPLFNDDGSRKGLLILGRDVTARAKAENEVKERNQFIQTVLDNLPIGLALNSFDSGQAQYMNNKFEEIYGWDSSVLFDMDTFFEQVYPDPDYRKEIVTMIMKDIQSGDPARMNWENIRITTSTGENRFVNAVNIPLLEQNTMISTVMDVTKEARALDALKESEEKYRFIIENIEEQIYIIDKNDNVIYLSSDAFNISLGKGEDAFGKNRFDLLLELNVPKSFVRKYKVLLKEKIDNKEKYLRYEYPIIATDITLYMDSHDQLLFDDNGEYNGIIGVVRDITERKFHEKELIAAKEKAEESDRLKSSFLANMSHEIRTPMNGILGFANLLEETNLGEEEKQEYIKIIQDSGNRMLDIINDLIDISKIESGLMEVHYTNFDLNNILNEMQVFFEHEAKSQGLELELINPSAVNNIFSDKQKLIQILSNLIKNAIKYTKKGSIEFGYLSKGDNLEFFVKDTGIGISNEEKELIFDRFAQSKHQVQNIEGAGLGLSISKAFVELLNGKIWIESKIDKGSTFRFSIPFLQNETEVQISMKSKNEIREMNSDEKKTILITEDVETSFILLQKYLKNLNLDILKAENGEEAVKLVKENSEIDLVLMDIRMPVMDGYEANRLIKEFRPDLPVVAQTAFALQVDQNKIRDEGFSGHLTKPIEKESLINIVEKYLY